jgi:hypothetical protein
MNTTDILTFKECLDAIDKGEAFSLTCVTWDEKRPDNSGNIRVIDEAMLLVHAGKLYGSGRGTTKAEEGGEPQAASDKPLVTTKKVDTSLFFIRDIQPLTGGIPVGHPIRVHPDLILFFNGKKVMP